MANSGVHRPLAGGTDHQAFSINSTGTLIAPPNSSSSTATSSSLSVLPGSSSPISQAAIHHHHQQLHQQQQQQQKQQQLHHHHHQPQIGQAKSDNVHFRGHQRRQSVARLLPDISKLRLLSWLIEASSELINCDIAIMDGVYAKLNRSQESLLFWNHSAGGGHLFASSNQQQTVAGISGSTTSSSQQQQLQQPAPPSVQPVANKLVISQRSKLRQKQLKQESKQNQQQQHQAKGRNHHSLPLTNYDASSLAAVSLSASLGPANRSQRTTTDSSSLMLMFGSSTSGAQQQQQTTETAGELCDDVNAEELCDSNQSDDDDDNSSATSSSTSSSGIHGTSLSSAASSASSSCSASDLGQTATPGARLAPTSADQEQQTPMMKQQPTHVSSAEQLSEKIRRTVMEHNYLQSLLVNIIRQHDRQRDLLNRQRRRLIAVNQVNVQQQHLQQHRFQQQQRIDLTEIADALDDGCLCSCHSQRDRCQIAPVDECSIADEGGNSSPKPTVRSSTLPADCNKQQQQQQQVAPARKVRRLKKLRGNNNNNNSHSNGLNREDIIQLLADKLCENCFDTHYWLHGCSIDLMQPTAKNANSTSSSPINSATASSSSSSSQSDISGIIAKRNATFIRLVQQEVRSTISKSIELIDLIRKEIKLPESIKQKQLMRCFSTSIQLLTSVGNYVVPAQDISTFIPEVGQQQTTLFCLPSSDFDHLLLYPSSINNNNNNNNPHLHNNNQQQLNYHLASVPDIPIRRRARQNNFLSQSGGLNSDGGSLPIPNRGGGITKAANSNSAEQLLSLNLQRLKTSDNSTMASVDSSSGNSSNNSSASSSIARGTVQQSSLTRAQTSSAILDGKASHDLSFETIANLSRQQTEDDMMFQSRPRFWQSSKFNFIKKLLHVKQQRLLRQQSKDRRIYNNKVQNKFRLVIMDLTHFNKSQQLLTTENGVNSLLTSMRNVLEFGLYLTLKLC